MKIPKNTNIVGMKFNRLTVLEKVKDGERIKYRCKCDCGKETLVKCDKIKSGHTKSCGCLLTEHCMKVVVKMRKALPEPRESWKTSANRVRCRRYVDKGMKKEDEIPLDKFIELTQLDCTYCGAKPSNKFNWARDDEGASQKAKDTRRFYL